MNEKKNYSELPVSDPFWQTQAREYQERFYGYNKDLPKGVHKVCVPWTYGRLCKTIDFDKDVVKSRTITELESKAVRYEQNQRSQTLYVWCFWLMFLYGCIWLILVLVR